MSTTLAIDSFIENNLRERTTLTAAVEDGAQSLTVEDTADYAAGDIIYIGELSRAGCEKAVVDDVTDETTLALVDPLTLAHARFEPVTSVVGDVFRIYRASNVDGTAPADGSFSLLDTRDIDANDMSSYYNDNTGSSSYWYKWTNYNATSHDETAIGEAVALRGGDFGHYASLTEIRKAAGFENNFNLKNSYIDQHRVAAEDEINSALATAYSGSVPFSPVPSEIKTLTIQLATGLLWLDEYGDNSQKAKTKLKDARAAIAALQAKASTITDVDGTSLATATIDSYFGTDDRNFTIGMKF